MKEREKLTDEELCAAAQKGDEGALNLLFERYAGMVKALVRSYYLVGGDAEDLLQEGMIGLFKAVLGYNGKSAFRTFARLCVKRRVISAIKADGRDKHKPLNDSDPLPERDAHAVSDGVVDPATEVVNKVTFAELKKNIAFSLSEMELKVLSLHLEGYSYEQIGEKLGKSAKAADNALQRIRGKIERIVDKEGA